MIEFEWDEGNLQHIILDHPERGNTVEEVESIVTDPYFRGIANRVDDVSQEQRYGGVGIGTQGIEKYVAYVIRNGKIRPITCYPAKPKQRQKYYEFIERARALISGDTKNGNGGTEGGAGGGS